MQGSEASQVDRLGRVQSLVRAFSVLDELCKTDGMTLSQIARLVDLPRSTTHRLLTTMEALNYVRFEKPTNHWLIGVQAFTVGAAFAQASDLGQLGRGIMRSLMQELQHSVNIAVPEKYGMCYIGQVEPTGVRRMAARPGACLPMHTTASGKALMASWTEAELDRFLLRGQLAPRTRRSISDAASLRAELHAVRERGYATDDEEHEAGLRCVAAVITDRFGSPRGSISVSDSISRLGRDRLPALGPTLAVAASRMSSEIAMQLPS